MPVKIPFNIIGGAYESRDRNNMQELINMFVEVDNTGGDAQVYLRGTHGLTEWFDSELDEEVRGFDIFAGVLYVIIGETLYSVTGPSGAGGIKTAKGTLGTSAGQCQIFNDGTKIAVCDGLNVYSQAGVTLTLIRTASHMAYQDGWFIISVPNTGSALASTDLATWVSIAAEGNPDFIVSLISDHRELILFGTKTTEINRNTGNSVLPFARTSGGFIETGCGAKYSPVKVNNSVYFLDDNNQVRVLNGLQTQIISTPSISYQIGELEDPQEATGYTYSIEGHVIYVLTFPGANITYCFDTTTNMWYKWSTGGYYNRHTSNCFIRYSGYNLVGDKSNGKIYVIDPTSRLDDVTQVYRERITQYTHIESRTTFFERLLLDIQTATELTGDPKIMLDFSDDFGHTWSTPIQASLGKVGQFNARVEFFELGAAEYRLFRLRITDECFVSLQRAHLFGGVSWE